ncbi:hypothetical protein A7R75_27420 [Mycolicibacterium llatzerense]|uniref:hypothetical protein n=1 Tax=Mycolicibacterium llatzerense TaxID=280871 RepID=UPI0036F370A9|nr:hypothetical protein [Mycolicibacterium llatzerense]
MRALTVQQPWAGAIIFCGKLIENRRQLWTYRGPLAIHAGKGWSESGGVSEMITGLYDRMTANGGSYHAEAWSARGAIIGVVDLVDCHHDAGCCRPWGESGYGDLGGRKRSRVTHLVLENPRALAEPIPVAGQLGLWNVPTDIAHLIEQGIAQ